MLFRHRSVRVPVELEELELPYEIEAINVRKGEQKQSIYLAINPNGKVPHLTGIGPAFGQVGFFKRQAPEHISLAIARFQAESERVLGVLDGVLAKLEARRLIQRAGKAPA
jgi:GSH-dependent disulfide-bond oxidoreductase